jgi:hypothetical protein
MGNERYLNFPPSPRYFKDSPVESISNKLLDLETGVEAAKTFPLFSFARSVRGASKNNRLGC